MRVKVTCAKSYMHLSTPPHKATVCWRRIRGLFKKCPTWFFSAETNEAREVCCRREVEGTLMRVREFFPPAASVACSQRVNGSVYAARVSHFYFLRKCLGTQIEFLSAAFSGGGTANNRKEPCRDSKVPVEPQECCVWPRKFESASARISRTLSAGPNRRSKWNVPNQCLSPPPLQVLGRWHDGPAWPKSALGQWARHFGL